MNKLISKETGLMILEIETDRLRLESFEKKHMEGIYQITTEAKVREFLPDWISTFEQRMEWLEKYEVFENHRFVEAIPDIDSLEEDPLRMAIVLKETNQVIGWIVSGYKEELAKPNREIGYAISNTMTGCGYATEAAVGLVDFIFQNTTTKELVATARDYNDSSNAVIKKSGFVYEKEQEIDGHNYFCYRLKKS